MVVPHHSVPVYPGIYSSYFYFYFYFYFYSSTSTSTSSTSTSSSSSSSSRGHDDDSTSDLRRRCVPRLIQGVALQHDLRDNRGYPFRMTLLARRSQWNAGTRYLARGLGHRGRGRGLGRGRGGDRRSDGGRGDARGGGGGGDGNRGRRPAGRQRRRVRERRRDAQSHESQVRSIHWFPYDRVGVVNAVT